MQCVIWQNHGDKSVMFFPVCVKLQETCDQIVAYR